jgi:hypothetical protein
VTLARRVARPAAALWATLAVIDVVLALAYGGLGGFYLSDPALVTQYLVAATLEASLACAFAFRPAPWVVAASAMWFTWRLAAWLLVLLG